jgi:hypothetical protein
MSITVLLFGLLILCSVIVIIFEYKKYENFEDSAPSAAGSDGAAGSDEDDPIATNMYSFIRTPMMKDVTDIVHDENSEHTKEILDKIQPSLSSISNKIDLAKTAAENIKFPTEINVKEATPEQLQSMYASISPKLLGDIRKAVKNEIIAERSKPVVPNCNADYTDSTAQGKEYSSGCNNPEYIRKDSIPCWNCTVK